MGMPARLKATPAELAEAMKRGDTSAKEHWKVVDGVIVFDGQGQNLITDKEYGDFELYVDWKIEKAGDSGIYVRGNSKSQVNIWCWPIGSGGRVTSWPCCLRAMPRSCRNCSRGWVAA